MSGQKYYHNYHMLTSIMAFRSTFLSFILANVEKLKTKIKEFLAEFRRLDCLRLSDGKAGAVAPSTRPSPLLQL